MDELTLYSKIRDICTAHTNTTEQLEIHGFGVGYLWHMNLDNFDQSAFRKDHFYSEKWYQTGKDPQRMILDFPFVLLLPPGDEGHIKKSGVIDPNIDMRLTFIVFDLLNNDRNNVSSSDYAKRSKEQVWRDTKKLGRELLKQLGTWTPEDNPNDYFMILDHGAYSSSKVFEWQSGRLAGTQFEIKVRIIDDCGDVGSFDYSRTFPENKSSLSKS